MTLVDEPVEVVQDRLLFQCQRGGGRSCSAFDRRLGRGRARSEGLDQALAIGSEIGVDVLDDLLGRLRDHAVLGIEVMRAGHRHMDHSFVTLEELKAHGGERIAQRGGDTDWEPLFLVERDAQQCLKRRRQLGIRLRCEGVYLLDERGLMNLSEVGPDLFHRLKHLGLRDVERRVLEAEADRIGPLLHNRLVLHDLHAALVHVEVHPGEPLGVELAEFLLVAVEIRWPQQIASHTALSHQGPNSLGRITRHFLGLIEGLEMCFERVLGSGLFIQPEGVVEIANKERLDGHILLARLVTVLNDLEAHGVAFGLLHHQTGYLEEGIGATTEFDLSGQRADAALFRSQGQFDGNQRFRTEIRTTRATTGSIATGSIPTGAVLGIPSDARSAATRSTLRARTAVTTGAGSAKATRATGARTTETTGSTRAGAAKAARTTGARAAKATGATGAGAAKAARSARARATGAAGTIPAAKAPVATGFAFSSIVSGVLVRVRRRCSPGGLKQFVQVEVDLQ